MTNGRITGLNIITFDDSVDTPGESWGDAAYVGAVRRRIREIDPSAGKLDTPGGEVDTAGGIGH